MNEKPRFIKNALDIYQWLIASFINLFKRKTNALLTNNPVLEQIPIKRALLIGSNFSKTEYPLNGCMNDLQNMKSYLQTNGFSHITMVSDDAPIKKPNQATIISELTDFLQKSKPDDILYVHFSGHGTQGYTFNRDEVDYMDEYICTYEPDNTISYISDDTLHDLIKANLHINAKLYIVFDCCHSGSMLDLKYTYNNTVRDWVASDVIGEMTDCGHVIMLSGCRDDQTSADAYLENKQGYVTAQGALTCALLDSLEKEKSIIKIYDNTLTFLSQNWCDQYPLFSTNKRFDVAQPILSLLETETPPPQAI